MKKQISLLIAVIAFACICLAGCDDPDSAERDRYLTFDGNGGFKIVQLTDMHEFMYIEADPEKNIKSQHMDTLTPLVEDYINSVIDTEKPDLVVLTGDNTFCLSGWADIGSNGVTRKTYRRIAQIFEDKKQYWALTFGNHDSEGGADKPDIIKDLSDYDYFIGSTQNDIVSSEFVFERKDEANKPDQRYGNYSIPIKDADGKIKFNVYLLDSGSYNSPPASSIPYRTILDEQCEWYRQESDKLLASEGQRVPSLLFLHIPLKEHKQAYDDALASGNYIGTWGGFSPSTLDTKIFEYAVKNGDIRGIFTGHNHNNSITCFYKRDGANIMMGITPMTQSKGYQDTDSVIRSRIFKIKSDGDYVTYIHSSDGAVHEEMSFLQAG